MKFLTKLWDDDCGALIATEWVLAATLLVLGAVAGMVSVRSALVSQMNDFAGSIVELNPSYHAACQHSPQASVEQSRQMQQRLDLYIHSREPFNGDSLIGWNFPRNDDPCPCD